MHSCHSAGVLLGGGHLAIKAQGVGSVWDQRAWEPDGDCEVDGALLRSSVNDRGG